MRSPCRCLRQIVLFGDQNPPDKRDLVEGKLVIQALTGEPLTLDELLRGVTEQNLHGEWDTGPAVGREVW